MKKISLWHIAVGLVYEAMKMTAMSVRSVTYTIILTVAFMIIASAGYLYIGAKEYKHNVWITALILLIMTLSAHLFLNPLCRNLYTISPIISLLLFPYGGAQPFIQLGVYLAVKDIYFGVILGNFALFIPSALTLTGVFATRIKQRVQK